MPVMDQAFTMQPSGDADRLQKIDRALLEHAGANARQHVGAILALEDDRIDAVRVQQLPEQQPCRPGADDGDLRAQNVSPRNSSPYDNSLKPSRVWIVAR